jgi:predicted nuclease of predicted toxin-antitoxin system
MRFLADESCDFAVVRALRSSGHDVVAVSDIAQRAEDLDVITIAVSESRILLTEKRIGQNMGENCRITDTRIDMEGLLCRDVPRGQGEVHEITTLQIQFFFGNVHLCLAKPE